MKRCLTLLLALCLLTSCALAEADALAMQNARQALEDLGYPVSDEAFEAALEQHRYMREWYAEVGLTAGNAPDLAYQLLLCEGFGEYDYDTLTWTPTSDKIYVFDAEFFDIEGMYTQFLQGVQAILPEGRIENVCEDLSGLDENLEGSRKVGFEFEGHVHVVTLDSYGDWLNTEIIDFFNQVLKAEGFDHRLHIVSEDWDQIVFLICGTKEDAAALRRLMGVESSTDLGGETGWLDWFAGLFQ